MTAVRDLVSRGGMPIAEAGDVGEVACDRLPSRSIHRGLVPVYWRGRKRAYWVSPDDLKAKGRGDVRKLVKVSPVPEKPAPVPVPKLREELKYHFGRTLQWIRQERGLSQEALAEAMRAAGATRVSQATLSKWESRRDSPSGRFIEVAARVLDVPAFLFFVDADELPACVMFLQEFLGGVRCGGADAGRHTLEKVSD